MRIAIVSTPFVPVPPRDYGGTELVVHALVTALQQLGHDVAVFATRDSRVEGLHAVTRRAVWPPDPYTELLHCRAAAREISEGSFDVVHAHAPAFLAFADELEPPVVYTIHHAADPVLARFYAGVHGVHVAISARQGALVGVAPHAVVHHGLDPAMYPDRGPGGPLALFLGRLVHVKGPDVALAAARAAGLPAFVAGSLHQDHDAPPGWREEALLPALNGPDVTWRRHVGLAGKRALFARAQALVAPARWEEPFGLALIEALLAGCPVVTTPRGAAPELVRPGHDGFLVEGVEDTAEALRAAASLDRGAIQADARRRFSAARMARDYLGVYEAALRGRGSAWREEDAWSTAEP